MNEYSALEVCRTALDWAKDRGYAGWDPYDGLSSPIFLPLKAHWLGRLLAIHSVSRIPINPRPILRIPKQKNPKGIGIFIVAYLNLYESTGVNRFLEEAERLLDWLCDNQSPAFELPCWGYNFDWQNGRKFYLPANHPSIVVTTFCGRSFLRHHELTGDTRSLKVARRSAEFIQNEINTKEIDGYCVYTYTPYDDFVLVNTNALAADYFYRIGSHGCIPELVEHAEDLFEFVVDMQNSDGAWYYSVPSTESHLKKDNFHTGFVLESLGRYSNMQSESDKIASAYRRGLEFYRKNLFDGCAPRFEASKSYPYDAHAAAQAIITFAHTGDEAYEKHAIDVYRWAVTNLWSDDGYFYRRKGRFLTDRTPYMRWSQAWLCRALSVLT